MQYRAQMKQFNSTRIQPGQKIGEALNAQATLEPTNGTTRNVAPEPTQGVLVGSRRRRQRT